MKNKIILSHLIWALLVMLNSLLTLQANEFGRIVKLKGDAFISSKGKTVDAANGSILRVGDEFFLTENAEVDFVDLEGREFTLAELGSITLGEKSLNLRSGTIMFMGKSFHPKFTITSVNSSIDFEHSYAIVQYDAIKGRTQIVQINGQSHFANYFKPELNTSVQAQHFSFIDRSYEEGAPRIPTSIGAKSFEQMASIFIKKIDLNSFEGRKETAKEYSKAIENHKEPLRTIASVNPPIEQEKANSKQNDLEIYKSQILEKKEKPKFLRVTKNKLNNSSKKQQSIVHVFGASRAASIERAPASMNAPEVIKMPESNLPNIEKTDIENSEKELLNRLNQL